jgi:hypothetical protein
MAKNFFKMIMEIRTFGFFIEIPTNTRYFQDSNTQKIRLMSILPAISPLTKHRKEFAIAKSVIAKGKRKKMFSVFPFGKLSSRYH